MIITIELGCRNKMPDIDEINYRLRPAKSMERKMMVDILLKVAHIRPMTDYRYVGFGSIYFSEFRLFHQRLGIDDMVSIEKKFEDRERVEFNMPYDCIDLIMKDSQQALNDIGWEKPLILWLDYTSQLRKSMLNHEFHRFFSKADPGSVIFVTFNAQPPDIDELLEGQTHRDLLEGRFGAGNVPPDVRDTLTGTDLGEAFRKIISSRINSDYLGDRNSGRPEEERLHSEQICNFIYNDSSLMTTLGWIILSEDQKSRFEEADFSSLDFVNEDNSDQYRIPLPQLTFTETRVLEDKMPRGTICDSIPAPDKDIRDFREIYRFYPRFTESEL